MATAFTIPLFKVTDPNDPNFDPSKFELIDTYWIHAQPDKYKGLRKKTGTSLRKVFPQGTDISDVEQEMLEKRKCKRFDISKSLNYPPFSDNPNSKAKKFYLYRCGYEWWGLFFYSLNDFDFPRLKIKVLYDKDNKVIRTTRT